MDDFVGAWFCCESVAVLWVLVEVVPLQVEAMQLGFQQRIWVGGAIEWFDASIVLRLLLVASYSTTLPSQHFFFPLSASFPHHFPSASLFGFRRSCKADDLLSYLIIHHWWFHCAVPCTVLTWHFNLYFL